MTTQKKNSPGSRAGASQARPARKQTGRRKPIPGDSEERAVVPTSIDAEPSLQDELRNLKIERILQAAAKLFMEHGFVGTTMDAIAEQLKMTKPFIYQYFDNKHAVLAAICDRELRESLSMLNGSTMSGGAPVERLKDFIRTAMRRNIVNRGLWTLMAAEEKHLPKEMLVDIRGLEMEFHKRLSAIIEDGAAQGVFLTDQPQLASRAVMGMTQWVRRWYRTNVDPAPEVVVEQFCEFALRMLGTPAEYTHAG
ncbi:TetR/AcrR family transcriptional regulator [Cupriavidus sp. 8B]